ncbi:MAG: hypothetical protein DMF30_01415 [Verrucomicrobia bacterium]|nr:MAG: hypothetical protein DMF30_01415 [Verrucomicrobiota bacterium]
MPDPVDPSQPPPVSDQDPAATSRSTSTGLPANVAAAIACIPLIGGIIFYILEKQDNFVRFYAMQSIIFGCAWVLFNIVSAVVHAVFSAIPGIGGILVFFWALIAALVHLGHSLYWADCAQTGGRRLIVAALCERRIPRKTGGHRPPLQPEELDHYLG